MKRKIIGILVVTLLLYASFLPAAEIIDNYEQNYLNETEFSNYPDDFELMAYSVSIDTWETNYKLEINNEGLTRYYCMYPEDREQLEWTLLNEFTIPSNSMDELWNEILDNDFFNLDDFSNLRSEGNDYGKNCSDNFHINYHSKGYFWRKERRWWFLRWLWWRW